MKNVFEHTDGLHFVAAMWFLNKLSIYLILALIIMIIKRFTFISLSKAQT